MATLGPYRQLGESGVYPDWLRVLKAATGVYAIMSRHFQRWRRSKRFWSGMRGTTEHDPGETYSRDAVEVAFAITIAPQHLVAETVMIARLKPRDNLVEDPSGKEPIPF